MQKWIGCLAAAIVGAAATSVSAQDVATVQRNIQLAEQTLRNEPYLTQHCAQLKTGDYFFHRGRRQAGKEPVIALTAWETALKRAVAAGRMSQARADNLLQEAKRRRNEVQNACNLDHWKAELARLQRPKVQSSADALFAWNATPDAHHVLNGKGTLTGGLSEWRFTGQATPSWNGAISARVECVGKLDPGRRPDPGANGRMRCRAEWVERGKRQVWDCQGPGTSRAVWSIGDHWFGIWPTNCVGTITADGKDSKHAFGLVSLKSRLGLD